jgi:Bacterial protein of unknown function (DUF899)
MNELPARYEYLLGSYQAPWRIGSPLHSAHRPTLNLFDLFEGRRQLIIYHFMFDPEWDKSCPGWSERPFPPRRRGVSHIFDLFSWL